MERNTEENQFLSETNEFLEEDGTKNVRDKKLLILWIALGVASVSFLVGKFLWN